jgi:lipopolysaccharide export system permease protein
MLGMIEAERAQFEADDAWLLSKVRQKRFGSPAAAAAAGNTEQPMVQTDLPQMRWPTQISSEMVAVALLRPDRMRTIDLFTYIRHLQDNGQNALRYEIEFWRKVFYPLSCLVMVILALPFAYLQMRSGGISAYVFAGVMIGISFFMMNNVAIYVGNLQQWQPWLAAAAPGLLYTAVSLTAFGWLVLRR